MSLGLYHMKDISEEISIMRWRTVISQTSVGYICVIRYSLAYETSTCTTTQTHNININMLIEHSALYLQRIKCEVCPIFNVIESLWSNDNTNYMHVLIIAIHIINIIQDCMSYIHGKSYSMGFTIIILSYQISIIPRVFITECARMVLLFTEYKQFRVTIESKTTEILASTFI